MVSTKTSKFGRTIRNGVVGSNSGGASLLFTTLRGMKRGVSRFESLGLRYYFQSFFFRIFQLLLFISLVSLTSFRFCDRSSTCLNNLVDFHELKNNEIDDIFLASI